MLDNGMFFEGFRFSDLETEFISPIKLSEIN